MLVGIAARDGAPIAPSSTLALFISSHVEAAIRAAYVTYVAEAFFNHYKRDDRPKFFTQHPGVRLTHASLSALEERAIVNVAEQLREALRDRKKVVPEALPRPHRFSRSAGLNCFNVA